MADNSFFTPVAVGRMALGALVADLVLPRLVSRDAQVEFDGQQGTVVNVRVPSTVTGGGPRTYTDTQRDANQPIILDSIVEDTIPITMGPQLYKGVRVTENERTFEVPESQYASRIIEPLATVVAQGVEQTVVDIINGITEDSTITPNADGSDIHEAIIAMRRVLNIRNVPQTGRVLAVSPDIESMLLNDPSNRLVRYDASGSSDALRNATVGRLYGFETVVVNSLEPNSAVAFQPEAFSLAVRAPSVPRGATWGQGANYQGIALRVMQDYDTAFQQDRVVLSTFAGAAVVDARRVVRVVAA